MIPEPTCAMRRSGRKPGARVTNSARLFTPAKMRTPASVKSINNRGRVDYVSKVDHPTDRKNMADVSRSGKGKEIQKNICKK